MSKPRWSDKWRALLDMKAARNVGVGTTSQGMQTARPSVSDVGTMRAAQQMISAQQWYEAEAMRQEMAQNWLDLHTLSHSPMRQGSIFYDTGYNQMKYGKVEALSTQGAINSSSDTETPKESCAVFRQGTLTVKKL